MVKKQRHIYVIGAGMSGLSTALRLAELGIPTTIIEKEEEVGGLAGSFSWGTFKHIDYGPHIYHTPDKRLENFWKKEFGDLFYENEFWGKNVKGEHFEQYFDYPLSFESLKKFPDATRKKILYELAHLDDVRRAKAKSYSEYVRELVGPTLMELFFIRYPQKLWGVSIEHMTANWAPKRVNFRTRDEHFHAGQWSAVGKYGSGAILKRMAELFKKKGGTLLLGSPVGKLEHARNVLTGIMLQNGKRIPLTPEDVIVSTIPIPLLAVDLGIKNNLQYRSVKLVFIAVKKSVALPDKFNFLYYDAPEILFNRVSEQKKFCPVGFPKDKTLLTCEIAYTEGDSLDKMEEAKLVDRVRVDLERVGLAKKGEMYDAKVVSLPYVYPLQLRGSEIELAEVRSKLSAYKQLYCIGTGGDFRYEDLQILNLRGFDLAERLASSASTQEARETVKKDSAIGFNHVIMLGDQTVSDSTPAFIIAEIGLNHNGNMKLAKELIDRAVEAGSSAVKFQTYSAGNRISKEVKGNRYAEKLIDTEETTFDMLERLEFSAEDHVRLFAYAKKKGIEIFSTPFDIKSVDLLESLGCRFYKISSMDLVNIPLIRRVAQTGKPMIVSTGMSTLGQVEDALDAIRETGNRDVILLHCVSAYPTAAQDTNIAVMEVLQRTFGTLVGFSDHTIGLTASTVALAQGARVIERHFTLDRFMEGPDHILSSDPEEMRELVRLSRLIPLIIGKGEKRILPSETETINRFKKCLYAQRDIRKGQRITPEALTVKGPGGGVLPKHIELVVGRTAKHGIKKDHPIQWEDI